MKFNYRLSKLFGLIYNNGNIIFDEKGSSVISVVGNRIIIFDLIKQINTTLPFENNKDIDLIALSNNGEFLVTVDVSGSALFINLHRRVLLQRFRFSSRVFALRFSPDDSHFAVTGAGVTQIWSSPGIQRVFSPLHLSRVLSVPGPGPVALDWSPDSGTLVAAGDLELRVFSGVSSRHMSVAALTGHRDLLVWAGFEEEADCVYSVARDGALFIWNNNNNNNNNNLEDNNNNNKLKNKLKSKWILSHREFLWEPHTLVESVDYNKKSKLLLVGFDKGVFSLYQMPHCINLYRLSVSHHSINTVALNSTGEWLALGSKALGQLIVWEWKSESYILKQQGHIYGLKCIDYSSDGHYIATGGEDGKVKLWNTSSGFCFVTFSEHIAPITGIKFFGNGYGKGILSCSLDGTVRAHDLMRYKNFKTLTTPTPVQFTCLTIDNAGEIVCAGAMDPFQIYIWSLQTGRILDVLSGHEGPIACLDFTNNLINSNNNSTSSVLASGSWDGTLKLWNIYENICVDTFEHGCDVLACSFRPDGKQFCTCATNGCIYIWDVETATQISIIEGRRDIAGGRLTTDKVTADNSAKSKYFTTITYTADGNFILAAGRSKYCCIYSVITGILIKKFQLSHNKSLEGILDQLRSDRLVDGINLDTIIDSDNEELDLIHKKLNNNNNNNINLPGVNKNRQDGSRTIQPEIICNAICFSNTGTEWAAATTQGLQVFSLDENMMFAPTDIDITITPQTILKSINNKEFSLAINMSLHLGEQNILKQAIDNVPLNNIDIVVLTIDIRMLKPLLIFLANVLENSKHIEYYLQWCYSILQNYHQILSKNSILYIESLRSLIRIITQQEKDYLNHTEKNQFVLNFLELQCKHKMNTIINIENYNDNDNNNIENNKMIEN